MTSFEDESLIRNIKNEILFDRLSHPNSSIEERIIRKELERRGLITGFYIPHKPQWGDTEPGKYSGVEMRCEKSIPEILRYACATPVLYHPTRFTFAIEPAKDDFPPELKINVKRHNIKFNFNN